MAKIASCPPKMCALPSIMGSYFWEMATFQELHLLL